MTTQQLEARFTNNREAIAFAMRALLDFGLTEEFESRSEDEQLECLRWIDASSGERQQECRISLVLDDLAAHRPLHGN